MKEVVGTNKVWVQNRSSYEMCTTNNCAENAHNVILKEPKAITFDEQHRTNGSNAQATIFITMYPTFKHHVHYNVPNLQAPYSLQCTHPSSTIFITMYPTFKHHVHYNVPNLQAPYSLQCTHPSSTIFITMYPTFKHHICMYVGWMTTENNDTESGSHQDWSERRGHISSLQLLPSPFTWLRQLLASS